MSTSFQAATELGRTAVLEAAPRRRNPVRTRFPGREAEEVMSSMPATPWDAWQAWSCHGTDMARRSILFWDTIHRRGNQFLEHERAGKPPVLAYEYKMIMDGRTLERPVNLHKRSEGTAGSEGDEFRPPWLR